VKRELKKILIMNILDFFNIGFYISLIKLRKMKNNKILVIGSSNTDMIVKSGRIPRPGETVLGGEFRMEAGGKGANQAVAAARAGGEVTFIAKIGRDIFGEKAIDGFKKENINTEYILKDEKTSSGIALICVDEKGENSISVASGANFKLSVEDIEKFSHVFNDHSVLLVQLETPLSTIDFALETAHKNGMTTILNPAPAQKLSDKMLSHVNIITPNETEAEILTGIKPENEESIIKSANYLHEKGIETVILTLGKKGVYVRSNDLNKFIPSIPVEAVDTTAAGDVFNGYLASALSRNMTPEESILLAIKASAISVTRFGAQPSIPYLKEPGNN
jgi:ribokinase